MNKSNRSVNLKTSQRNGQIHKNNLFFFKFQFRSPAMGMIVSEDEFSLDL